MTTRFDNLILYDGLGTRMEAASLLIDGERIAAAGREAQALPADCIIDGTGLACTPGWIQSHSHIALDGLPNMQAQIARDNTEAAVTASAVRNSLRCLKSGLTGVRDMGTAFDVSIKLREAIRGGVILGPHIYASGRVLCMTGGHGADFGIEVDGADEARKAARGQIKRGADLLKIMATGGGQSRGMKAGVPQLNYEEILAITEEAHHAGISAAAHAQGKEGVMNCLRAGVDCIEHGVTLDGEQIDRMVSQGTWFCPTLMGLWYVIERGTDAEIPQYVVDKCKIQAETHFSGFTEAYKAGVKILAGTDAGTPFNFQDDIASEFRMMNQLGMNVDDIIISATSSPAKAFQAFDKTGSIEAGKWADLTFVEGDPKQDLDAFKRVRMVYKMGRRVYEQRDGRDVFLSIV
ncbi:MAG: amidohydrolase family protein [Eubacteriales bacterium]|nr:amidohydrolase family protein [Eubacteriales bacterium]